MTSLRLVSTRLALFLATFAVPLLSLSPLQVFAATEGTPPRVAVLPFELIAPQEMGYLVEGVRTMLGSRLAASGTAELVEPGVIQQATGAGASAAGSDLVGLGRRLAADYLVSGKITAMGEGVSLDVNVHEVKEQGAPQSFFASAASAGGVIPAVDTLAREIKARVLTAAAPQVLPPAAPAVPQRPSAPQQPSYVSPHPERQLYGGWGSGSSPFIRPDDISWLRGYSKSHDIPLGLRALEAADITGDGQLEFILAGPNQVEVYRRDLGRFTRLAMVRTLNRYTIHYLSAADLDGDGRAEVYVSAADHLSANSTIMTWNGETLVSTHDEIPYYIRAVRLPMSGTTLVGQRSGAGTFLLPGLLQLLPQDDSTIKEGDPLGVPAKLNIFDFTYADLDGDGTEELVTINQNDRLEVYNAGGGWLWRSDGNFGGTTRILGGVDPSTQEETVLPHEKSRHIVPSRIIVRDVNLDGVSDVVVVRNIDSLSRVFGRLRAYSGGEIHALSWDGAGMNEIWRTRRIDGYIADIQMGPDLNETAQDGQSLKGSELYVGVVLNSNGINIFANSESAIYVYPVEYKAAAKNREQ